MREIRSCNVAVVGGAGFLGSHLVQHLIEDRGCLVTVIDNLSSGRREFIHPEANFEHHDITGSEAYLYNVFRQRFIHYVFNYAAIPYIPVSFSRPVYTADVNFMGAMKVINAAQESGCEAVLQVSSAEIYGEGQKGERGENVAIAEDGLVQPHSSYGASKAAIDYSVQVRWRETQCPVIALRQFNCIGERETHPYVLPEIISQISAFVKSDPEQGRQGVKVKLGNNSFRDFQYAGDAVRMATELLEKGQFGEVYNMGSETGIKVYDLAKLVGRVSGDFDVEVVEDYTRKRPWEIWHLLSDNCKLYSTIDARPTVTLEEAVRRTVFDYNLRGGKWAWE